MNLRKIGVITVAIVCIFLFMNFSFASTVDITKDGEFKDIEEIIDEYIRPLSLKYNWGYDASYYIASVTGCHPNYASFLMNKQTLHVQDIYAILSNLDIDKRALYDREYIGAEYIQYLNHHVDDKVAQNKIKDLIKEKKVLLLAPGKSLKIHFAQINKLTK